MKICILACFFAFSIAATPLSDLTKSGSGEMRYLWWSLYDAELYLAQLPYQANQWPQALKLTYQRDITKEDLIDATADQWQQLKLSHPQQQTWLTQLAIIWPDIQKNDELILLIKDDGVSYFYFNQQLLGSISQAEFGPAFLAIWLDAGTSEPKLRQNLLGVK
ncbi:chalcone isomerase family protein [Paraglaciecola sp.]|uniref:chalcone isomerase family protein n=1 Tax=Paraglaciecola sp. TaxID=1920173 RepID=UPI0030F4516D